MKFGEVPLAEAEGTILAHSTAAGSRRIRKGTVLTADLLRDLDGAGHVSVVAARLEPGDVPENDAAERLARALVPDGARGLRLTRAATGRVNVVSEEPGIIQLDAGRIDAINAINPMLTLATLAPFARVGADDLVATIKIIAFAVPEADLEAASAVARNKALSLLPPRVATASLIETRIEAEGEPPIKGRDALARRLAHFGVALTDRVVVPHDIEALAKAVRQADGQVVFILTGSATSDIADTAPAAVIRAGGTVIRYGMPVDPGNLLFLGEREETPIIGLPGCARSPALNGADWVLERVICGLRPSGADIAAMGVGGLLKEIPQRPSPRRRHG